MTARVRIFSLLVCVVMIFCSLNLFCFNTVADGEQTAFITTTVIVREAPGTWNKSKGTIGSCMVSVLGSKNDTDGDLWYLIRTSDGLEGYVYSKYIALHTTPLYNEDFEKNLLNFPESYRGPLRELHNIYPNWKFTAHKLDMSFDQVVYSQYGTVDVTDTRKWVELTYKGDEWRDPRALLSDDKWIVPESDKNRDWTYASYGGIAYFADPRNYLNINGIFAFLQQSYDAATQTRDNLKSVIQNTFLADGYGDNKDAYIDDIMQAAAESGVNPCVIASTIIIEQGTRGESSIISGTYAGYNNYYNFFNFGASGIGDQIIISGLEYAKNKGWNSRRASIIGGAKNYADGYISIGQDTYYYKAFNVINKVYSHQYENAIYAAWNSSYYLKKGYVNNQNAIITFKIPVFTGMSNTTTPEPSLNPTPTPTNPPVTPTPTSSVKRGDIDGNSVIDEVDLAAVKLHILGRRQLSRDGLVAADIDGNSVIDEVDLAAVKLHILGRRTIG